jgi:NADPH:quinone reductase
MKAVVVTEHGGSDVLHYTDVEKPKVGLNQVLIKMHATSVNFADIKARIGKFHVNQKPPYIPGLDIAGTIEGVGPNVKSLEVGQRVIAFLNNGSYAEYVVADEKSTFPISEKVDFDTAAACPIVSFTAYNLLVYCAKLQPGETVLIHAGAGGVGTTAIQLAKLLGAKVVIATVGSNEKVPIAKEAGADYVFNYQEGDFVTEVQKLTENRGVDIILDSLAGEIFEKSLACLSYFGRIINFGNSKGSIGGKVNTLQLHSSCRSVIGYSLGTTRKERPEVLKMTAEGVLPYIESGQLKMVIGKKFKLSEAARAQQWIEDRKSTGKILLCP